MNKRRLGRVALALVILLGIHDGRAATKAPSCGGETWHVTIARQEHPAGRVSPAGNYNPAPGVGSPFAYDIDFTVHGTYVSKPTGDGKFTWTHRTIDWSGHLVDDVPGCRTVTCDADSGGERELGPLAGGGNPPALTTDEKKLLTDSVHCKTEKTGNCVGYFPAKLSMPAPEIVSRDQLPHRKVELDGTRYSISLESHGQPGLVMLADRLFIPPNKGPTKDRGKDDPTSQIRFRATCDGKPLDQEEVQLRIDVEPRSGGHNHINARPRGKLDDKDCGLEAGKTGARAGDSPCITVKTDRWGLGKVMFESPLTGIKQTAGYGKYEIGIAGDYKVTAKLARYPDTRATVKVLSRVERLQMFQTAPGLTGDTSNTVAHPQGSYATAGTFEAFKRLALDFQKQQGRHNDALVQCFKPFNPSNPLTFLVPPLPDPRWPVEPVDLNDIALPKGGIFDLDKDWKPSHFTHNKGEGGDFNRFGAGDKLDPKRTRLDCDGSSVPLQWWWAHLLLGLGEKYGKWDCKDLQLAGPNCVGPSPITSGTDKTPAGLTNWFPHRLHLHVEDRQ